MRKSLLKLRKLSMHKVGCCGIGFSKLKGLSRDIINFEEFLFYIHGTLTDDLLNDFIIWANDKIKEGIQTISFEKMTAERNNAVLYYYNLKDYI